MATLRPDCLGERTLAEALAEWDEAMRVRDSEARTALLDALGEVRRLLGDAGAAAQLDAAARRSARGMGRFERWLDGVNRKDTVDRALRDGDLDAALGALRRARGWYQALGVLQLIRVSVAGERFDIARAVADMALGARPPGRDVDHEDARARNAQLARATVGDEAEVRATIAAARLDERPDLLVIATWRGLDALVDEWFDTEVALPIHLARFDREARRGRFAREALEAAEALADRWLADVGWRWAAQDRDRARRCLARETERVSPDHEGAEWVRLELAVAWARGGFAAEASATLAEIEVVEWRVHARLEFVAATLRDPALDVC